MVFELHWMLVCKLLLLLVVCDPMTHRRCRCADLLCDLPSRESLLVQYNNSSAMEEGQASVAAGVRREQRRRRREPGGRRGSCSSRGWVSALTFACVAEVMPISSLRLSPSREQELQTWDGRNFTFLKLSPWNNAHERGCHADAVQSNAPHAVEVRLRSTSLFWSRHGFSTMESVCSTSLHILPISIRSKVCGMISPDEWRQGLHPLWRSCKR